MGPWQILQDSAHLNSVVDFWWVNIESSVLFTYHFLNVVNEGRKKLSLNLALTNHF